MLEHLHIRSIRGKLLLAIVLTSAAAVLVSVSVMVAYERWQLRRQVRTELITEAELIARSVANALAAGDAAVVRERLGALWVRGNTVQACVHTADGQLVAEYDPSNSFPPTMAVMEEVEFGKRYARLRWPVLRRHQLLGYVTLREDLQPRLNQLRIHFLIALATIVAAMGVAIGFSWQLQRFIAAPLLALTRAAHAVVEEKDYGIRVLQRGDDETGSLTDAFNQMLEEIARRQAEVAASEQRYRLLVENAPEGIGLAVNGRVAFLNDSGVKLLGARSAEELIGRPIIEFVHPDFRAQAGERIARLMNERQPAPQIEERFLRVDGSAFDVEVSAQPVWHQNEPAIQVCFRDITERKRAEQILAHIRRFNERILQTVPDIICVYDLLARRNIYVNRALERSLGITPQQFLAESFGHFVHPQDKLRFTAHLACLATARDDEFLEVTCRFRSKDDEWRWLRLRDAVFTRRPDGTVEQCICVGTDITALRELEQEILEITERERARIGHDLHDGVCQHLVGVTFVLKLLREKLLAEGRCDLRDVEEIERLIHEAIQQARMISQELYPERFLEEGLCVALRQLALNTTQRFSVQCVADCPDVALPIDVPTAHHLYRIAQEAVSNALKHAKPRQIHLCLELQEHFLRLLVQDDGIGMAGDAVRPEGLGLRIMQYRARMIGAQLSVRPSENGGTLVVCQCPLQKPSKDHAPAPPPAGDGRDGASPSKQAAN